MSSLRRGSTAAGRCTCERCCAGRRRCPRRLATPLGGCQATHWLQRPTQAGQTTKLSQGAKPHAHAARKRWANTKGSEMMNRRFRMLASRLSPQASRLEFGNAATTGECSHFSYLYATTCPKIQFLDWHGSHWRRMGQSLQSGQHRFCMAAQVEAVPGFSRRGHAAAHRGAGGSWTDWRCCCSATPRRFSKRTTAPRRGGCRLRPPVVSSATAASPLSQPTRRPPTPATPAAAPHSPRPGKGCKGRVPAGRRG